MSKDLVESFSGIRGIYGEGMTKELARKYVFSYLKFFNPEIVVVGFDTRPSSPILRNVVIECLKKHGVKKIIDIGFTPIQVAEYAVTSFKAQGGIYISASHNEPEYNGFKFLKQDGAILNVKQFNELKELVYNFKEDQLSQNSHPEPEIVDKHKQAIDIYINFVLEKMDKDGLEKIKSSKIKILVDPNGGTGINVLGKLFKKLGVEAKIVNNKLGEFNRIVQPTAESLSYLTDQVVKDNFEFACGFDCDADRVEYVINPNSKFAKETEVTLNGNYVLALACDAVLKGTENEVVINTDASSYLVRDVIKKHQAIVKEVEVGETNVVEAMKKYNSVISGEGSCAGVIIPPIMCRDGIMATALIIKMIAEENKSLVDILNAYPVYYQIREKVKCSPESISEFKKNFEAYFKSKGYKIQKTGDETGGLKAVADENNFVWCRQSKTELGAFRIWADGDNKEKVKELIQQAIKIFKQLKNH